MAKSPQNFLAGKIAKKWRGLIAGAIIGLSLRGTIDMSMQLQTFTNPSNVYTLDEPFRAAKTTTIGVIDDDSNHSLSSTTLRPFTNRLSLEEITRNPPAGSLECPPHATPIYDRIVPQPDTAAKQKIPKIVHISFKSRCVPTDIFGDAVQRWKDELPDYSIYFHDDDAVDRLLQQTWPEFPNVHRIMECMKYTGAMKIDLWRMLAIYQHGGIYTDIDNVPAKEFRGGAAIHPEDTFFASSDGKGRPTQFIFAMEAQHPIAFFTIQNILANVLELSNLSTPKLIQTTGPQPFGKAYIRFLRFTNPKATFDPGVYQGFMNKTIRHESKWNWYHPLIDEMVEYNNKTMTRKERAFEISGLKHWWKATRKSTDHSGMETSPCREYLYRMDHRDET